MIQVFFVVHDEEDEFFLYKLESSPMRVSETNLNQQSVQVHKMHQIVMSPEGTVLEPGWFSH